MIAQTLLLAFWIGAVIGAGQLYFPAPVYWIALGGVNLGSFLLFGADKFLAERELPRIPEAELWFSALIGGGGGALAGELCFRHKSAKTSFNCILFPIAALQILLGGVMITAKLTNGI